MSSLVRLLPGFPTLTAEELHQDSILRELERDLIHARQRLESVETLADASLRDSRLLAEYLQKDLEHLGQRLDELETTVDSVPKKTGLLRTFLGRFKAADPENLRQLQEFSKDSEENSQHLTSGLRQASARLDSLEDRWKSIRPAFLTSQNVYLRRLRRILWITISVILLGTFASYRVYRDQPQQKFERKHLKPLKSVLDPKTYEKMEGLARASRSDFLRIEDLIKIRIGLETFQQSQGRFPGSRGERFSSGGKSGTDWIPEIRSVVPATLPVDRRGGQDPKKQYLYITNGAEYKLLAQSPENCTAIQQWMPELLDPVRGCQGVGFWTEGAQDF
ncbi:MAG: hypothetical protein CMF59_18600 [Leptospiraceae bacterium]|nr:hypothetical protein [Leptospiraceae bacterium]